MRIDLYMVEQGLVKTRSLAQDYIKEGCVLLNDKPVKKASVIVGEGDVVHVSERELNYVSRAGMKLHHACEAFQVNFNDAIVLDVGASTGGFSQVALQQGARLVYAVDVGHDQLVEELRNDPRIKNYEGMNARALDPKDFTLQPEWVVMDVSFISLKTIFPALCQVSREDVQMILLIKPQFEAGKKDVGKHGIVKDRKVHIRVLREMQTFFESQGFYIHNLMASPVVGRDGNQEYICYLRRDFNQHIWNMQELVTK
ncbi:MAG: TlyA family RNA methyltransferase [Erysipelotrichaceae bacterium]